MKKLLFVLMFVILSINYSFALTTAIQGVVSATYATAVTNGAIGVSTQGTPYGDSKYWYWNLYTTTTAGTIGYCHVWAGGVATASKSNVGIYNSSGAKLVDGTGRTGNDTEGDPVLQHFQLDSTITISAATQYYLVYVTNDASNNWEYLATGTTYYYETAPANIDTLESTLPTATGSYPNGMTIWCNNSATE